MAIKGMHALFYTRQSDALRDFFLKLGLAHSDVGEGWLIFDVGEGDFGVHPTEDAGYEGTHAVSFYCDDVDATVRELAGRGVTCSPIMDQGWGRVTDIQAPGGVKFQLYEPRYRKSTKKAAAKRKATAKKAPAKKQAAAKKAPAKKAPAKKKTAAKAKKKR